MFIGANAGYSATGNNKLYIDNSSTSAPLIYGDFGANTLTFNGSVNITGSLTKGSGSFVQPHPTDPKKEVVYAFFEGPEHAVFFRGKTRLVDGKATIETPEYFRVVAGKGILPGVLSGTKVLDLTHYICGPFCTELLSEFGAEVVKVGRPGTGEPARHIGPFFHDEPGIERSGLFMLLNNGKKSITLDLKTVEGKKIFRELVQWADIVVENFSYGVMDRLGLGYDKLVQTKPDLIMTSISNLGQTVRTGNSTPPK